MKKYAAIIIGLTAVILLTQTNLFNDLLFFFLVGAIPGTTKSVPSYVMLSAIVAATGVFVFRFTWVRNLTIRVMTRLGTSLTELKTELQKRRFGDA